MERKTQSILIDIRRKAAKAGVSSLLGLSIVCGNVQDENVDQPRTLTPIPSIAGLIVIPPEGTVQPMPEKTQNMVLELDGKAYIEIPMKEGVIPKGDMTIELMTKLRFSLDPYETVGGSLFFAHKGIDTGFKEYGLSYKRNPTNPFVAEERERLGANYRPGSPGPASFNHDKISTIIGGGETDIQPGNESTETGIIHQDIEQASSLNTDPGWKHIVLQRRGDTYEIFVDGKLVETQSGRTATISKGAVQAESSFRKQDSLIIGGRVGRAGFKGQIKDFALSNVARYNGDFVPKPPVADDNTIILMPLNGDTNDYSSNRNNGIIVGTGVSFKPR